jgi:hypothetical protein
MKTINIHGKQYVEVKERIKYFREIHTDWGLTSEILDLTDERCVIKATITNQDDRIIATGIAYETKGSSFINKTSFIENCETSAWGRALANLGIGLDVAIASADEVLNAKAQDKKNGTLTPKTVGKISMNVRVLENLLKGISLGKIKEVKESMTKYDMTKEQEKTLTVMINTTK